LTKKNLAKMLERPKKKGKRISSSRSNLTANSAENS
jgi:hypothetical protein